MPKLAKIICEKKLDKLPTISIVADPMTDIYDVTGLSDYQRVELFEKVGTPSSEHGLRDPKVQQLINSTDLSFDLVINEDFYHDSWLMFGYKFNAPTVTICECPAAASAWIAFH